MKRTINYKLTGHHSNTGQDADVRARATRKGEERCTNALMYNDVNKLSLVKIAATVIIGLALSVPAHPGSDKYSRSVSVLSEQSVQPVEGWMLDRDYLSKESAEPIEPWMLEPGYLNEEAHLLESWMFDANYLKN